MGQLGANGTVVSGFEGVAKPDRRIFQILLRRYRLEPAPGGGTRLTRDTSWRRHLAPAFYFGWLQDTIMRRGQDRLLELLRQRIDESEPWEGSEPPAMSFSGQSPPSLTRSTGAAVDPGPAVAAVPAARL